MRPAAPRGDDGSVLIMALVFLSLFGLTIAAVLGFAGTGFKTASSVHGTAERQYAADAAIEGAINAIRPDVSIGKAGVSSTCFTLPAAAVNSLAVSVDCTGRPGSGVPTGGAGGGAIPANSVLTLPTNAGEGVILSAAAAPLVSGNVLTNQTVTVPAGASLRVQGSLTCRAATGTGTVTPPATTTCPATPAPAATDPAYALPIATAPAPPVMPTCAAGATVTFLPGTYRSAAGLNALMGGGCPNKRFHFTPGNYYFEFTDVGTHEWRVNDATAEVVGGTLTTAVFPNRCDLAQAGVEFLFGTDSRLSVTAGSLELCPPLSASQRIAVRGVSTTTAGTPPTAATFAATSAVNTGTSAFTTPGAGAVVDGTDAAVSLCNKCSGTLNLTGYPAYLPANAVITAAVLRVTHAKSETRGTVTARLIAGDGALVDYPVVPCVRPCAAGTTTTSVDVLAQLSTPAKANNLTVQYTAEDSPGQNAFSVFVDGVDLAITYSVPGLKASSGCAVTAPYSPASGTTCAVLKGTGGATTRFAVKGTVYAPLGAVDLSMTGQLAQVTQRGIIARTLQLGLTSGAAYTGPVLSLPGSSDRQVLLTATIAGRPALRADVTISDGLGATPGTTVAVTRWSVLR